MTDAIRVSGAVSGTDKTITFETGKLAQQSQGAVLATIGTTAVLATANAAFVMLYSLGMLTGAPVVGVLVDTVRPHGFAFGFALFCALYGGLVAWRLLRRATQ